MAYKALHYAIFLFFIAVAQTTSSGVTQNGGHLFLNSTKTLKHLLLKNWIFPRLPADLNVADLALFLAILMFGMLLSHGAEEIYHLLWPAFRPLTSARLQTKEEAREVARAKAQARANFEAEMEKIQNHVEFEDPIRLDELNFSPLWKAVVATYQVFERMLISSNIVLTGVILAKDATLEVPALTYVVLSFLADPIQMLAALAYGQQRFQVIEYL